MHSVAHFLESFLSHLDTAHIELIAYHNNSTEDELTLRIKPCFSLWRIVFGMEDQEMAQLIHADRVNILLDLSGHSLHNRLPVFAWKPAPVQVTWLGFPTTTGVAEIDYILGDPIAIPPEDEGHFSEKVWHLPETYLCLSAPTTDAAVSTLPALESGIVTLASFNNPNKLNEETIAVWARVLKAIPNSQLFLKSKQFENLTASTNMLQRFSAHNIDASRLIIQGATFHRADHLAIYQQVDIALDPFPYPGVTTSAEALWMGVPVLTMQGNRFLSRTAASIARNAGLSEWIACDKDDYVAKAVRFASDLHSLATLRTTLREQVRVSPLFDAPRFAKHFEDVLWSMWRDKSQNNYINP